eukprot:1159737-Pelagomonas_calceolata.AAC.3
MGREPLGLPLSGKVHTWLPWAGQGTPRYEPLATLRKTNKAWQPCSVSGAWEAVAAAVEISLQFLQAVLGLSQPAYYPPETQHACQAKVVSCGAVCVKSW